MSASSDDENPLRINTKQPLTFKRPGSSAASDFEPRLIERLVANEEAAHARIEDAKGPKPDIPADTEKASREGNCIGIKPPRGRWARGKHPTVCGREAIREGRCKEHYLRDVLRVSTSGKSSQFRPFWQYQVPLRDMSDSQHLALKALPISTSYQDCIARMNEADPERQLAPIHAKP